MKHLIAVVLATVLASSASYSQNATTSNNSTTAAPTAPAGNTALAEARAAADQALRARRDADLALAMTKSAISQLQMDIKVAEGQIRGDTTYPIYRNAKTRKLAPAVKAEIRETNRERLKLMVAKEQEIPALEKALKQAVDADIAAKAALRAIQRGGS